MTWNTTRNCTICSETPFKVPTFSTRNRTPGTDVASHLYVPNYLFSLNHFSPPTFPSVCPCESERERAHFPHVGKVWTFPAARSLVIYFSFTTSRKQHLLWPFARVFRFAGNIIPADGSRVFLRFRKTWSSQCLGLGKRYGNDPVVGECALDLESRANWRTRKTSSRAVGERERFKILVSGIKQLE